MSIYKKLISCLGLILVFLLIIGFSKDIWQLLHADERIKKAEEKLIKLKEENQKLQGKLDYYQKDEFLEEQIRNKLQMAKPGEVIVVLPEDLNQETTEEAKISSKIKETKELANWQKWFRLFWENN